jgi:uncharacterized membrane protein YphA (DoxX/SURF4 family)
MNTTTRVFLVLLRIAVGWHFLYEGLFKIESDQAAQPYLTSRYFLQASTGRLRDFLAGPEPPTLASAEARIDQWNDQIVKHFQDQNNALTEEQKARLAAVRDNLKHSVATTLADPESPSEAAGLLNIDWFFVHEQVLQVASEQEGQQHFTSLPYLQSSTGPFRGLFRGLVPDIDGTERLTQLSAQARIDQRYYQILDHFQSRGYPFATEQRAKLAAVREDLKQSIAATLDDPTFQARLADYKLMLQRVRENSAAAGAAYLRERLDADRKRLDTVGGELLGFVNEPLAELTLQAQSLATVDQMRAGPPPRPKAQTELIDWMVKWGLTLIGLCLMLGLFTPLAALAAALQLAMFYFATPPWPGLPSLTTEGHYLYVNRNLIELIAVLILFTTQAGRWAGLDYYLRRRHVARALVPAEPRLVSVRD